MNNQHGNKVPFSDMTTIDDVLAVAGGYFDCGVNEGREGREVDTPDGIAQKTLSKLRAAIVQYAAERVAEATAETRLRKLLNTPELHDAAQTQALIAILGSWYMDPPDGGDVPLVEQLRRMSEDARLGREERVADQWPGGKYANVLVPFFALMEAELHANASKGDRPGWLAMSREVALLEIYWHTAKLSAAVKNNDATLIREHAADVANMSMMLLDVCGGLQNAACEWPTCECALELKNCKAFAHGIGEQQP
jgi:hypothetical protein